MHLQHIKRGDSEGKQDWRIKERMQKDRGRNF